jgi:arylsulfatase A-like enzyme
MRPPLLLTFLLLGLASLPLACGESTQKSTTPRMNVVLISMDSVRQDRLGIYGHRPEFAPEVSVTPHVDSLAMQGVVFDEAWSTTSWTLPSHMSMMTGLTDTSHGVVHDAVRMDPLRTTLAESFAAAGYATAGFYSGPYLDPKYGFGEGFDYYQSGMMPDAEREAWLSKRLKELAEQRSAAGLAADDTGQDLVMLTDRLSHEDITSPRINELGLNFLDAHADQPFFLFLHYFDAHYDHIPETMEPGLGTLFDPGYNGSFLPDRWYFNPAVRSYGPNNRPKREIGQRDLAHIMAWYDAEIHWIDRHIGRVVAKLEELGLAENTIIAVVADHGDEFFEHGNIGHRSSLFPEVLRVPWVMKLPGEVRAGARIPGVVRLYDLAPTLTDYAFGGEVPGAEGSSARPYIEQKASALPREALGHLVQVGQPDVRKNLYSAQSQEVWRDGRYTLHRMLGTPQQLANGSSQPFELKQGAFPGGVPYFFFDRENDPLEQKPLAANHPAFRDAVERFRLAVTASQQHRAGLAQSPLEARYPPAKTEAEWKNLINLGYVPAGTPMPVTQLKLPELGPFPLPAQ